MPRPLVAVAGRRAAQVPILRFSATLAAEAICEAVWAAGGEPVIVHGPAADPLAELSARLTSFDAVLLPGGADMEPSRYGAEAVPETTDTVAFQDEFELGITRAVVELDLPLLAICRGMQVLNVALGGSLLQHVPETNTLHHNAVHRVDVKEGSRLHAIVGAANIDVSSYHHQAIDRLAADLVVTAVAADGLVEAVEHRRADVVAVQWHPEDRHATSDTDAALFADLVDRARKRKDSQ
ncbi:MAG: gamma-glutamyl-gamma-aminobutyrate hydrolase family protein [Mycobacterium sp.]|nr:gamma-glutamyl-gamma-aminobutyrate hydrolase family protein [Mycobacterium sp.]